MERRETQPPNAQPELSADTRRIADRLQELSIDEAERVLQRAIELQTIGPGADPADTLDTDMLAQIAAELDIDARHLEQALLDELLRVETDQPGALDRLLVPASMTTHGAVAGSNRDVREVVDAWMVNHEGMRKRAESAAATKWEKDRGFGAFVRKALKMSRGDRALRTAVGVTTAVRPATDTQQVVVLEADTSNLRMLAVGLVAGAAAVGVAVAGTTGALDAGGLGLDSLAAGAGTFAMLGGGVLIGMKMWANRIRSGLNRAVEAISSPHLIDRDTSVPSAVRRWVDNVRTLRNDVRDDSRS